MSPRIPFVEPEDAEGVVQNIYEGVEDHMGLVPNILKVVGNSPQSLRAVTSVMGAMEQFDLHPKYRELAYLKTSSVNDCEY